MLKLEQAGKQKIFGPKLRQKLKNSIFHGTGSLFYFALEIHVWGFQHEIWSPRSQAPWKLWDPHSEAACPAGYLEALVPEQPTRQADLESGSPVRPSLSEEGGDKLARNQPGLQVYNRILTESTCFCKSIRLLFSSEKVFHQKISNQLQSKCKRSLW